MKITAVVTAAAAAALASGLAACGVPGAQPATHQAATHTASEAATQRATVQAQANTPAAAKMTAAMSRWYSGATVTQAANVCGDVYRVYSDNVAVNSGSGSSSLEPDITRLQGDIAAALSTPPPDAHDAAIWKRILNAYSNAAGAPTGAGLSAASRRAKHAAWTWTPSFGGTLLVCLNVSN